VYFPSESVASRFIYHGTVDHRASSVGGRMLPCRGHGQTERSGYALIWKWREDAYPCPFFVSSATGLSLAQLPQHLFP